MRQLIMAIIVGVGFCFLVGLMIERADLHRQPVVPTQIQLPSVYDIQEELKRLGYYNGKIDGWYGEKTAKAHDRYTCDIESNKCFRKALGE